MTRDPIVAVSTARARAAIGIVRISGDNLAPIVARVFHSKKPLDSLSDRRPHLGTFLSEHGDPLDEGLLLWMKGPRSFTGEDVVELQGHGNPWILERIVNSVLAAGARAAQPGEFTRRAYLNGRMDLIQADAVIQLIHASSERGLQAARRLLNGALSQQLAGIQDRIVDVLKWVEMAIDFPEEDIDPASDAHLLDTLQSVRLEITRLITSFRQGHRARAGARVVLCGRANVGKSSLFNQLLGFRRSIVADSPGTTRDIVDAELELEGFLVRVQDTAGLRETLDVLEEEGIGMTREALGSADLVVLVVDGSRPPTEDDRAVLATVVRVGVPWLGILNRQDLGCDETWTTLPGQWLSTSARTGEGLETVRQALVQRLVGEEVGEAVLLTSRWQKEILEHLLQNIDGAIGVITSGMLPTATAYELYEALDRLDEMTGGHGRDDVMNRVFAEFCLGK